jgi:hypothetical protein
MSSTNTALVAATTTNPSSNSESELGIELQPATSAAIRDPGHLLSGHKLEDIDPVEFLPQPSTTVSLVERWNGSKASIYRTAATLFAFVIMGANDAAYGVSLATLRAGNRNSDCLLGNYPIP